MNVTSARPVERIEGIEYLYNSEFNSTLYKLERKSNPTADFFFSHYNGVYRAIPVDNVCAVRQKVHEEINEPASYRAYVR